MSRRAWCVALCLSACATPTPPVSRTTATAPAPLQPAAGDAGVLAPTSSLSVPSVAGASSVVATPAPAPDAGPQRPPGPRATLASEKVWSAAAEGAGSSSPRAVDLNGDGVLDVVVGGGVQGKRGWLYALDGRSGAQLWKAKFAEELYATPALVDVNRDGTSDVVIGGRDADLAALDGRSGKALWALRKQNPRATIPRRNFNGATLLGDLDGDGVAELLATQGGSYDDSKRLPGRLFVVSGATGALRSNLETPDGRETYSIPAVVPGSGDVVFGTGGETLPGALTRWDLDGGVARWAWPSTGKGFIASPILHDFDDAGTPDVVVSVFEGTFARLDGVTGRPRWELRRAGFESYASPALGAFGGSPELDAVTSFNEGTFPDYHLQNVVLWVDGRSGAVLDEKRFGVFASASPITVDFDGDGLDETLCLSMDSFSALEGGVTSTLAVFDGAPGREQRLAIRLRGAGAATPLVVDLDADAMLDVILVASGRVERHRIKVAGGATPRVRWGGFRGSNFDAVTVGQ